MIFGNLFYYLAETIKYKSNMLAIIFLIIGRAFIGIGGARLITRKFLAINVEIWA